MSGNKFDPRATNAPDVPAGIVPVSEGGGRISYRAVTDVTPDVKVISQTPPAAPAAKGKLHTTPLPSGALRSYKP